MKKFIISIDAGTTSNRSILFDLKGKTIFSSQKEFTQYFPKSGWVEHDPDEIWRTTIKTLKDVIQKAKKLKGEILSIGITNQRETTVLWDKKNGQPVYNAIVWQDRRTSEYCDKIKAAGHTEMIQEKTGLIIDAYFSASKINWILENVEGAREKAEAGKLAFGTVDSWLVWKLTQGETHVTDVTNASRTMLFNIQTMEWDKELLELFDVPASMLPEVKQSSEVYGKTKTTIFASKVPISGIAGDQQSALFGQMCTENGMVKNTYGTGCFMLMNIGEEFIKSKNNLLTTVAWKVNGKVNYAFEGSVFIAGAVVQWLRDGLKMIDSSSEVEALATKVEDTDGVYLVPAFAGLGAPYWNQDARGIIVGLSRGTTDSHIARAALESMAFQTMDVLKAMEADSGLEIKQLRVDGGATANNFMMQFQSDLLHCQVIRPKTVETTALGAAYLAGLAVGYWESTDEIQELWQIDREFDPERKPEEVETSIKNWKRAIDTVQHWTKI